jgi:hypothetical protein
MPSASVVLLRQRREENLCKSGQTCISLSVAHHEELILTVAEIYIDSLSALDLLCTGV